MGDVSSLFMYFVIYSFVGWVCETVFCSILFKKFVNRGFLNGPFCPVYGLGAMLLLKLLSDIPKNILLVFFVGTVLTTAIEYFTGWLLEIIFHAKWWDYSQSKLNYKGRICLFNSTLFGIMSVVLVFLMHPLTRRLVQTMSFYVKLWVSLCLFVYFVADFTVTVMSMKSLNKRLETISRSLTALKERLDISGFYNALNIKERLEKLHEMLDTDSGRAIYATIENFYAHIKQLEIDNRSIQARIIKAFPNIRSTKYPDVMNIIKNKVLIGKKDTVINDYLVEADKADNVDNVDDVDDVDDVDKAEALSNNMNENKELAAK